jgi:hypothetical protein
MITLSIRLNGFGSAGAAFSDVPLALGSGEDGCGRGFGV